MSIYNINLNNFCKAKEILLSSHDIDENVLIYAFSKILEYKIDYADIYFQLKYIDNWSLEEGIIKIGKIDFNKGFGIRAISDSCTSIAYSDDISKDSIYKAANIARIVSNTNKHNIIDLNKIHKKNFVHNFYSSSDLFYYKNTKNKICLLKKIEKIARRIDSRVVQVMSNLISEYDVIFIAKYNGEILADIRPLIRISITVVAEYNKRKEVGYSSVGGRYGYEYFTDEILFKYVNEAVNIALVNLDARSAPAGLMTVVLGPGWPGILLHEAIGHGLEGDFNRKRSSVFFDKLGKRVASKYVTIVDNGTLENNSGSLNIDDEGNITKCTTLIENGILINYMQDTLNANLMNLSVTGNARRESYSSMPIPRMTNTYMLNGNKYPTEIIESVKNGIYATHFSGGEVDITNGKFVFSISKAYVIENGKITYPIKNAIIIGNGPESLKCISMVGNDLYIDKCGGVCGKDGQQVPVCVGQPTLRIDNMIVGGIL